MCRCSLCVKKFTVGEYDEEIALHVCKTSSQMLYASKDSPPLSYSRKKKCSPLKTEISKSKQANLFFTFPDYPWHSVYHKSKTTIKIFVLHFLFIIFTMWRSNPADIGKEVHIFLRDQLGDVCEALCVFWTLKTRCMSLVWLTAAKYHATKVLNPGCKTSGWVGFLSSEVTRTEIITIRKFGKGGKLHGPSPRWPQSWWTETGWRTLCSTRWWSASTLLSSPVEMDKKKILVTHAEIRLDV